MPNEIDKARLIQKYNISDKKTVDISLEQRSRPRTDSLLSTS
jgi:hypothetical protein